MLLRIVRGAGWALVTVGALLLVFSAYQLWGTGVITSREQARLRAQLWHELPRAASAHATARAEPAPGAGGAADDAPAVAPAEATPAPGQPVGSIDIPSIGLQMVVVQGVAETDLAMGPGHYPGTPLPGEAGNVAIAGHRTTYLHPFYDLTAVTAGDAIVLTTPQGVFTYVATAESVVTPTDLAVIAPSATPSLTLTTCNPRYSAATRLVLHASLARSVLFAGRRAGPAGTDPTATHATAPRRADRAPSAGLAGSAGTQHEVVAAAWGIGAAALAAVVWLVARRRRRRRWLVAAAGAAVLLVVLFFFFGAIAPLLPASF